MDVKEGEKEMRIKERSEGNQKEKGTGKERKGGGALGVFAAQAYEDTVRSTVL